MNAKTKGNTNAPNGIIMIMESQGDNPAFLQMNQKGTTPKAATIMAMMKSMTNSGIPMGPMILDVVLLLLQAARQKSSNERE